MKFNALALSGIVVLLLALGSPSTPETTKRPVPSDGGEAKDSGQVPLPVVVSEPEPQPYAVFWHADWCAPCRAAKPALDRLEMRGVKVIHVDCTQRTPMRTVHGEPDPVRALPTISLYLGHEKVDEIEGVPDFDYMCEVLGVGEPSGQNVVTGPVAPPGETRNVCCCGGVRPQQCYCLEELRLGRRTTGCNCTGQLGSLHEIREDGPWPLGTYRRRINPE